MTTRAAISQRIFWASVEDDDYFAGLLEFLKSHRQAVDEVLIFTETDGQDFRYIEIEEVKRRAPIMKRRIDALRAAGIGASINVLNTIGHSDYADPFIDPLPWSGVIGPDGAESTCCSCPRQPAFLQFVVDKYTAYSECGPDWMWIDDDVRLFGHYWRVMHGCFCDLCLREFSKRNGRAWDRTELYQEIVLDTYPQANPVRAQWMHYLSDQIVEIHGLIRDTVHAVDPNIGMAAMNTSFAWHTAYYSHFAERYEVLRTPQAPVVRARPGGFAFTDNCPADAYEKAWSIALQKSHYMPATESYAEVENYPFQFFEKSAFSTAREASLYIAAGCEGVAFDAMDALGNDPTPYAPYLQAIADKRCYLDEVCAALKGATPIGLSIAFDPEHAVLAPTNGKDLDSTDADQLMRACQWGYLGIPLRFGPSANSPCLLHGQLAKGLPRHKLKDILRHGAVMDAEALEHLWRVGLGELAGVQIAEKFETGTYERFTGHMLNGRYEGYIREVSQGYYHHTATTFNLIGEGVEPMARLYNYRKQELGVSAVAVQSPAGGRLVVLGYRPWDYLGLPGKSQQTRNILDWLHGNQFPLRLDGGRSGGSGKSQLFAYDLADGGMAACLFNASADPLIEPLLLGQAPVGPITVLYPDGLNTVFGANPSGEIQLPDLAPWGECFIYWKD